MSFRYDWIVSNLTLRIRDFPYLSHRLTTRMFFLTWINLNQRESIWRRHIIIIQALVKWFKFTSWDTEAAPTCRLSGVGCTSRRVETIARGTWSRWNVSLGLLSECKLPLSLSGVTASGCQPVVYDALMIEQFVLSQTQTFVCLGAVCAPEAQNDFFTSFLIRDLCTAPTSASSVVTQKVMTWTHVLGLRFDCQPFWIVTLLSLSVISINMFWRLPFPYILQNPTNLSYDSLETITRFITRIF